MQFRNSGAFAALLLLARSTLAAPASNATATDDFCEADETITSTIVASSSAASASDVAALSLTAFSSLLSSGSAAAPLPTGLPQGPSNVTLGAAGAQQVNGTAPSESVVTEVVYQTNLYTVTSCAPEITNCPASSSVVSTQIAAITTTYVVVPSGVSSAFAYGAAPIPSGSAISSSIPSIAAPAPANVSAAEALGAAAPTSSVYITGAPLPSGVPSGSVPVYNGSAIPSGSLPSGAAPAPANVSAVEALGAAAPTSSVYITGAPLPSGIPGNVSVAGLPAVNATQQVQVVTQTYYSTNIHTITSCAASITNCPAGNYSSTSTELIPTSSAVITQILPASTGDLLSSAAAAAITPSASAGGEQTTLTVQITQINTILSCAASVTNCPAATATSDIAAVQSSLGSAAIETILVTSVVGEYTTICPVTAAEGISSQVASSMSSAVVTTTISGSASYYIPQVTGLPGSTVTVDAVQATTILTSAQPTVSVVTIYVDGQATTSTSSYDVVYTTTLPVAANAAAASSSTTILTSAQPTFSVVTVYVDGQATTSTSSYDAIYTTTVQVAANSATPSASSDEALATLLSIGTSQSIVTITVSGVESTSTSAIGVTSTITIPAVAAAESTISSAMATGILPNATAVVTELPVETVITVTLGSQVLTSTISTAAAVQTPSTTAPPQISTVYVTMGSSVLTNTYTASEIVAADIVTLTLSNSAGLASTYTMTVSASSTATQGAQITARPFGQGQGQTGNQCQGSTVTLISVSTLCATGSVCAAQATGL